MGGEAGRGELAAADDPHAVPEGLHRHRRLAQLPGQPVDAVGFLVPQFLGPAHHGLSPRQRGDRAEDGEFVDGRGDLLRRHLHPGERGVRHRHVPHRLPHRVMGVRDLHRRSHALDEAEKTDPRGVDGDVAHGDPGTRHHEGRGRPEGGARRVAGHGHLDGAELLSAAHAHAPRSLAQDLHPHRPEHPLGVVAGGLWLLHPGDAACVQPRQQNGAFDLGARHGALPFEGAKRAAAKDQRGERVLPAAQRQCPHLAQGVEDARHGTAAQVLVSRQHAQERMTRQDAGEEPHRGAGVQAVEHPLGFRQAAEPPPGYPESVAFRREPTPSAARHVRVA